MKILIIIISVAIESTYIYILNDETLPDVGLDEVNIVQ